jgi:hypothetical protein
LQAVESMKGNQYCNQRDHDKWRVEYRLPDFRRACRVLRRRIVRRHKRPDLWRFVPIAQAAWRRDHNREDGAAHIGRLDKMLSSRIRNRAQDMTMHDFEAKHWFIAALIILLAVGAFAYSWS